MEPWRLLATALLAVAGFVLVLIVMAKVRDRTGDSGRVAISGTVAFTALLLLGILAITVLPALLTWALVALISAAVAVMALAS